MPNPKQDYQMFASFWFWALAITTLRIVVLILSPANLGPDEAQYWFWSRDLDFGYFSKPPMIAWAIAATTAIFGNAEWAVRLSAPIFHFGAGAFIYHTAKIHFDQRTAFWAGIGWLTLPGVILSSFVIATDAPLLFFWSGGLYFLFRIIARSANAEEQPTLFDYSAFGAMIGLGLLSKYAMLFFIAALAISALISAPVRKALLKPGGLFTVLIAASFAATNIYWNAAHDFQTLSHTAANANWSASLFQPAKLAAFLTQQFAVAGIIPFAVLLFAAIRWRPPLATRWKMTTLLVFALTPLAIVAAQAFISRAHANWAASAYPSAIMFITVWLFRHRAGAFVKASIGLHVLFFVVFCAAITNFSLVDRAGLSSATQEIRGWKEQSRAIAAMADGYDAIVIDDRALMGAMLYYQQASPIEIVAIDPNNNADNHYEIFKAFDPDRHKRVLFVTTRKDDAHVNYRFATIKPLGPQTVALGDRTSRTYHLFDISGYYGRR
jgi:4-amino-4-deoxy-L-arabinose transferase-like glycosyltransferase